MNTYLVTGATRGFGLAICRALVRRPDTSVIMAARDVKRARALAATLGPRARGVELDVSSLQQVKAFCASVEAPLAGLVNNAGLQLTSGTQRTKEGWEQTIATNHLGAYALTVGLLPQLSAGGRVLFIGSATHNPSSSATRFGFRGARFTSIDALARGETDADDDLQAGQDRYATSKFLNTVTALELSRRVPAERTSFFTLDPGMMPGTGLARTAPLPMRILWATVLRVVGPLFLGASSTKRSARAAVWLLSDPALRAQSGECYGFDCKPCQHVWERVKDPALGKRVVDETAALTGCALAS